MAINKLKSNEINTSLEMKNKINEIIDILNGNSPGPGNAVLGAMIADLPTANPGPGGAWVNANVVTKGS